MGSSVIRLVPIAIVIAMLGASSRAEAAKIPIIYQTGQTSFESGPLPSPFDKEPGLGGFTAGYVCDVTGVFWSYFSIEDCRPAAINGDVYTDDAALAAAIAKEYPEPEFTFWSEHGWKCLAGGVGLLILLTIARRKKRQSAATTDERKTQFGLSAVDPTVAEQHRTAWERPSSPQIAPASSPSHEPVIVEQQPASYYQDAQQAAYAEQWAQYYAQQQAYAQPQAQNLDALIARGSEPAPSYYTEQQAYYATQSPVVEQQEYYATQSPAPVVEQAYATQSAAPVVEQQAYQATQSPVVDAQQAYQAPQSPVVDAQQAYHATRSPTPAPVALVGAPVLPSPVPMPAPAQSGPPLMPQRWFDAAYVVSTAVPTATTTRQPSAAPMVMSAAPDMPASGKYPARLQPSPLQPTAIGYAPLPVELPLDPSVDLLDETPMFARPAAEDDGPTTFQPNYRAYVEAAHAQQQRVARGSTPPQLSSVSDDKIQTALRAAQLPPTADRTTRMRKR